MSSKSIDLAKTIMDERGKDYSPDSPSFGATQLGRMWAATLSDHFQVPVKDIPPHVVLLMMAQLKVSRAARPFGFKQDNYLDGIAYLQLAEDSIRETLEGKPCGSVNDGGVSTINA
jgi:hypothetical protein